MTVRLPRRLCLWGAVLSGLILLSSCSSMKRSFGPVPGYGVDQAVAQDWNCNYEKVKMLAETAKESGGYWVPESGNTMCQVLGWLGVPNEADHVDVQGERSVILWYQTAEPGGYGSNFDRDQHRIRLHWNPDVQKWIVSSVIW